jgi:hypothetical protein
MVPELSLRQGPELVVDPREHNVEGGAMALRLACKDGFRWFGGVGHGQGPRRLGWQIGYKGDYSPDWLRCQEGAWRIFLVAFPGVSGRSGKAPGGPAECPMPEALWHRLPRARLWPRERGDSGTAAQATAEWAACRVTWARSQPGRPWCRPCRSGPGHPGEGADSRGPRLLGRAAQRSVRLIRCRASPPLPSFLPGPSPSVARQRAAFG